MSLRAALQEKRVAAGAALQVMRDLQLATDGKPDESMSGPDREKYEKAKADFFGLHAEVEKLEAGAKQEDELERLEAHYREPATRLQAPYRAGAAPAPAELTPAQRKVQREAFHAYLKDGYAAAAERLRALGPSEVHAMLPSQGDIGGFLVPTDFRNELIKNASAVAQIMDLATITTTTLNEVTFPTWQPPGATPLGQGFPTTFTGSWRAPGWNTGGTAPTVQNVKVGQRKIGVGDWIPDVIEIDRSLLEDTPVNLETELATIIGETLGLDVDNAALTGDGLNNKPRGIAFNPGGTDEPAIVVSGDASLIKYNGLVDLVTKLPSWYAGAPKVRMMMRRATLGVVLKLADSQNRPFFTPFSGMPDLLLGMRLAFSEFLDAEGANKFPIIVGDFARYRIVQRADMRLQRLTERYLPGIGILAWGRIGGHFTIPDAFRIQKVST